MPKKVFQLDDSLAITIYKRRSSRNLRLTLSATGEVRVSIPTWAPYKTGVDFAQSRRDWIQAQSQQKVVLRSGQAIGKAHRLEFINRPDAKKPTSRIESTQIKVYLPPGMVFSDPAAQKVAETACVRGLRHQAEKLLPQRLADLATKHNYSYKSVTVKLLKGRWGSCDQSGNIVLNLFLMQLPWELIDYVLLHELTHTKILRHGPPFWQAMAVKSPNVTAHRKSIRTHKPVLIGN